MRSKRILSLLGAGLVSLSAATADAAPKLRVQVDQRGDFVLLGNTLGHDCANGVPSPVVGTVGTCGNSTSDSGADVYWRSDEPQLGQARANNTITNANARSTAVLVLPAGATVTHAYLYWAAAVGSDTADTTAVIERPGSGGFAPVSLDATESFKAYATGTYPQRAYQSVADVTNLVQTHGAGAYRVSGVESANFVDVNSETLFAGWWMAVFYSLPSDPPRNLALFDGLDPVSPSQPASATISGFLVPNAGFTGKLGVVAFEGDNAHSGDQLFFNGGTALSNALNPSNNFFNGTRSNHLGQGISVAGDLPQLSGTAGSMSGLDLDIVDVTSKLKANDTSATIEAKTSLDVFFLGGFITSISTYKPDFTTSTKQAVDVNGGALLPGDVLKYTIVVTNTGNDASTNTVLNDPLPTGVTYVPGTLRIVSGTNSGAKTDAAGDDQANYNAATRTVTFRLGAGANASQGGKLAVGESTTVEFQVKVDANASGTIANQATIAAAGEQGAPVTDTPTDGNGPVSGAPPTEVVVDQCANDTHCGAPTPYCKTSANPNVCVACTQDSHCSGTTPTCDQLTNTCVCTPTNGGVEICDGKDNNCDGQVDEGFDVGGSCSAGLGICQASGQFACDAFGASVCNAVPGAPSTEICGDGLDSDCDGDPNNGCGCLADNECAVGEVCDNAPGKSFTCIAGCRGTGGNGCTGSNVCTSTSSAIGQCVQCTTDSQCGGAASGMVCNGSNVCVPGCRGTGGNGCTSANVCTSSDSTIGQCVACTNDTHCGGPTSARVCDTSTKTCVDGCRGTGGNGCSGADLCTSSNTSIGQCVGCITDGDCGGPSSGKVCASLTHTCIDGCRGTGGNTCASPDVCTSGNTNIGQCVQCVVDSDCGGPSSGTVCDTDTNTCTYGCRGTDGNACPDDQVCTSGGQSIGQCVGCLSDSDCGDATSGKVCDLDTRECKDGCRGDGGNGCGGTDVCTSADDTIGECVGCLVDANCGGPTSGMVCDTTSRTCIVGCRGTGGNGCASGNVCTSATSDIGQCVQCTVDTHCGTSKSGMVCSGNACTPGCRGTGGNGCQGVSQCTSTDSSIGQCVGCITDAHCGSLTSARVCDATTKTCIDGCRGQAGNRCSGTDVCTSTSMSIGTCVECVMDSDCGTASSGRICNTTSNTCEYGCRGAAGNACPTGQVCTSGDQNAGQCVGCFLDVHCGGPESGKVCDTDNTTCIDGCRGTNGNGCATEDVCTSADDTIGTCVECQVDSDCGDATSGTVCDTSNNTCIAGCRGTDGNGCFGSNAVCTSTDDTIGECVGCLVDSDCGDTTSGKVCDTETKTCADGCRGTDGNGCSGNGVCTSTDDIIGTCVDCLVDTDCGDTTSGKVCDTSTKTCTDGCRGADGNGCSGNGVCTSTDDTIGTCVDCLVDTDCGDTTSGKVCDTSTKTCTDGCRGTDGNGCSGNGVCTSTDDTVGTCVDCLVDSDCGDATSGTVCNAATNTCIAGCRGTNGNGCTANTVCTSTDDTIGTCVGCLADSDCGGPTSGKVCDTSSKTCTDGCRGTGNDCSGNKVCTSTDDTIGTCVGCLADSDCGGPTSGKVCDTTTKTCTDGCRGTGNGCSEDLVCTSADDTIGTCENPGTGGAGGGGGDGGDGGADGGTGGQGGDTDGGVGGDDGSSADDSDVWASGSGVLCSAQPGGSGSGLGWLVGGAVAAFVAARRRRR